MNFESYWRKASYSAVQSRESRCCAIYFMVANDLKAVKSVGGDAEVQKYHTYIQAFSGSSTKRDNRPGQTNNIGQYHIKHAWKNLMNKMSVSFSSFRNILCTVNVLYSMHLSS